MKNQIQGSFIDVFITSSDILLTSIIFHSRVKFIKLAHALSLHSIMLLLTSMSIMLYVSNFNEKLLYLSSYMVTIAYTDNQ